MDKNELEILRESMENGTVLNIFLDNRICLKSPVIEMSETELMVLNKDGQQMVQALDTISAIVF